MSKVKFRLKLTGLEFEYEGTREDVSQVSNALADQITGVLMPAASIAREQRPALQHKPEQPPIDTDAKPRKRSAKKPVSDDGSKKGGALEFTHDPAQWGTPLQAWNPTKKSLWLLYVVKSLGVATEMTPSTIANTFNKHFRQAGTIQASHVARDLGKAKKQAPTKVGEMTNLTPSPWFLTAEGEKTAVELVREGLGQKTASDE